MRHGHGRSVWRDCKGIRARGCRLVDLPVVDWIAPKSSAACTTVDFPPFPTVVHSRRRRCIRPHLRRLFLLNLSWCHFHFHEDNDNFPAALLHKIKLATAHSSGIRLCSLDHGSVRFHNRPPKKRRHGYQSMPASSNQRHQGLVCRCLYLYVRSMGLQTMCKG